MVSKPDLSRPPQQKRSRETLARIVETTKTLLAEHGFDGLTLQLVSQVSGVSIGAMYARFENKDQLIRHVHEVLVHTIDAEHEALFARPQWKDMPLERMVPEFFDALAEILRRHAPLLRPMMMRAVDDPVIAERGGASYQLFYERALEVLSFKIAEVDAPDAEERLRFALFAAYSIYRNHLGFGATRGEQSVFQWQDLKRRSSAMFLAYLRN